MNRSHFGQDKPDMKFLYSPILSTNYSLADAWLLDLLWYQEICVSWTIFTYKFKQITITLYGVSQIDFLRIVTIKRAELSFTDVSVISLLFLIDLINIGLFPDSGISTIR